MKPSVLLDYHFAISAGAYTVRALLKLEGKAPAQSERVPLNLSLVLDRSGSMAGPKLHQAREAAALLVRKLYPEDVVSVVSFDDEVITVAEPATGSEQAQLPRLIEAIEAGGTTNLSGGWLQGRDYVAQGQRAGASNRVLLLTDGQANVGITDPEALVGLCRTARERGITTTTIGFGADYDEHLLRAMADAGGGTMYYIETPDQAPGIFAEEIEGLLSLAAQNVVVEVEPGEAVQLTAVHHVYPATKTDRGLRLHLGDLYAREPKLLLLEFLVPEPGDGDEAVIAHCILTAHVLTSEGGVERQEVRLPISHPLSRAGHAEPEIKREMLLVSAARARQVALEAQERGDFEQARAHLRQARGDFEASGMTSADPVLREELQDLEAMEARMEPEVFSAADAKYLHNWAYHSLRSSRGAAQRISRVRPGRSGIVYRTGDAAQPVGDGPKILAYVVNDQGAWGKGFVMAVSARWPEVREQFLGWHAGNLSGTPPFALGEVQFVEAEPGLWVAHLLAQHGTRFMGGRPPLRYDALERTLQVLADRAEQLGASVHMPRIGTGLAGGRWDRVEPMIERHLIARGLPVIVYDRPGAAAHA